MKVVLVMITGAYQLLQAIWFYTQHPDYEYIALVKLADTNEQTKQSLIKYCTNSGIFKNVIITKNDIFDSNIQKKMLLGIKMFSYFIIGRKKNMIRKLIQEQVSGIEYDIVLVDSEISIMGGAFINCAKEKSVYILQEGLYDIQNRCDLPSFNFKELIGYAIAKMGYTNPAQIFKLKDTKFCYKLMSHPELATYRNFKEIIKLFKMNQVQKHLYQQTVLKTFGELPLNVIQNSDVILFSESFYVFTNDDSYYEAVHDWLKEKMPEKKILVKRHPRDKHLYNWKDLNISMIDASIPAEIIIPFCTGKKQIYMYITTCILDILEREEDYMILRFDTIKSTNYQELFVELQTKLAISDKHVCTVP